MIHGLEDGGDYLISVTGKNSYAENVNRGSEKDHASK
jgi:hypothetical protein